MELWNVVPTNVPNPTLEITPGVLAPIERYN